jgi:lysophospholipase L1-like esterase
VTRAGAAIVLGAVLLPAVLAAQSPEPDDRIERRLDRFAATRAPQAVDQPWRPSPRTDRNSQIAHAQMVEKSRQGLIDAYFIGDSITRRWGALDYPALLENWQANFFGWNAANFGWGADRTEHMLWRLENGEFDRPAPRIVVIQAGTNNVAASGGGGSTVADVTQGITAIVDLVRRLRPAATIVVTAILPRNDKVALMPTIRQINVNLARLADGKSVRFVDIGGQLADADGRLFDGMMNDDLLHPTVRAYQIWADALKPIFLEVLGPRAAVDKAPAPTGDPGRVPRGRDESARRLQLVVRPQLSRNAAIAVRPPCFAHPSGVPR